MRQKYSLEERGAHARVFPPTLLHTRAVFSWRYNSRDFVLYWIYVYWSVPCMEYNESIASRYMSENKKSNAKI